MSEDGRRRARPDRPSLHNVRQMSLYMVYNVPYDTDITYGKSLRSLQTNPLIRFRSPRLLSLSLALSVISTTPATVHEFYVHVDGRKSAMVSSILSLNSCKKNVDEYFHDNSSISMLFVRVWCAQVFPRCLIDLHITNDWK